MKYFKSLILIAVAIVMLPTTSVAQKQFEGKIVYSIELTGEGADQMPGFMPTGYEFIVKGERLKFKMNGGIVAEMMGEIIVDGANEKSWMLKHNEETAYIMPNEDDTEEPAAPQITKEDEIVKIAGLKCQKYKVVSYSDNGERTIQYLWVTDKYVFGGYGKNKNMNTGGIFNNEIKGIPLKVMSDNMGITMVMTAVTFEDTQVSDSEFEIPAGYEEKEFDPSVFGGGN